MAISDKELVSMAFDMLSSAYCPYSGFPVGAALECSDGRIFTGCNIENAAYGSTICAERTALCKAVSEGSRHFTRLAIAGNSEAYCWPCGACRQMLYEFGPDMTIIAARADGTYAVRTLRQLLPEGFGPEYLED